LPLEGPSRGIIVSQDLQVLELANSCIGLFFVCCKFKSSKDNFECGLIRVYGPNDNQLRCALFKELPLFMSSWDIRWCLGGDCH